MSFQKVVALLRSFFMMCLLYLHNNICFLCKQDVKMSVTRVIVIDHLMLNPAHDIYILVHAQIKYQVEKLKESKITGESRGTE